MIDLTIWEFDLKKVFLCFTLVVCAFSLSAYDFLEIDKVIDLGEGAAFFVYDKDLYFFNDPDYQKIEKDNIFIDEYGYYWIRYIYFGALEDSILIPGDKNFNEFKLDYLSDRYHSDLESYSGINEFDKAYFNIDSIESTSFLTETLSQKTIEYKVDNLFDRFSSPCRCHSFSYNIFSPPWVEGVPGHGINEEIEVTFTEESDYIVILNGFVHPAKRHLYKNNSRLKRISITSINPSFNIEYTFEDVVHYADITFPEKTKKVTMTILDVYEGSKYQDTCISAIFAVDRIWNDVATFMQNYNLDIQD